MTIFQTQKIRSIIRKKNYPPRRKNGLFFFLLLLCLLPLSGNLYSQGSQIFFDKISIEQGLSQSSVFCILQDRKGFIWFATLDGLNKYNGYDFITYRNDPKDSTSLPDNAVTTIFEDSQGNLWVGTKSKGFCKFNPFNNQFKTYQYKPNDANSVSNNTINAILEDMNGNIWIGSAFGLNKFNPKKETFVRYYSKKKSKYSISSNYITAIIAGPPGHFWIGTNQGLNKFNFITGEVSVYKQTTNNKKNTPDNYITCLYKDESKDLWVGTMKGVAKLMLETLDFETYYENTENKLPSDYTVNSLVKDEKGTLWIGTKTGGLVKIDTSKQKTIYKHNPAINTSISVNEILYLYKDKTNTLWAGTSLGGVNKWNTASTEFNVYRHDPHNLNSLSSNQIRSIYEDKEQNIWIGTVNSGLNLWNRENNTFKHYKNIRGDKNSLSNNHVRKILEDSKGNIWIGTDGGGVNLFDKKKQKFTRILSKQYDNNSLSNNRVWDIFEDNRGRVWIATFGGGLNLYNPKNGKFQVFTHDPGRRNSLSDDFVTTIYQDYKGVIWVGTYGGGINSIDQRLRTFTHYKHTADTTSIGNDRIYCITEDSDKNLWIGAKGSLNLFNRTTGKFIRYTEANGFPNDVIMGILEDKLGYLWISTNKGIVRFDKKTESVRGYDYRDGLQGNEFLVGSYCKTSKGEMLFGGINGFNAFFPNNLKANPNPPPIVITGVKVSNKKVKLDTAISEKKLLELSWQDNSFSFDFVALDYVAPEKNQYSYRMKGFDKNWINIGTRRFAYYTNLSPAKYVFQVRGSNNDGVWNHEGASLIVRIKPAFWQTSVFKISLGIIIALLLFGIFRWRTKAIHRQKEQLENEVKLRTAELIQQNEEIETQRDMIEGQKDVLEKQRDIANQQRDYIAHQKKEIMDSILYAKRIQTATLPREDVMKSFLPNVFVLFKPKDIVSGDFYWAGQKSGKDIIVSADCTGHGVPGAFMSMFGVTFLNEIVKEKGIVDPGEVLNEMRDHVIVSLKQRGVASESKDGMDMAICMFERDKKKILYAGANSPLYHVRDNQINVVKSDRMPIWRTKQ